MQVRREPVNWPRRQFLGGMGSMEVGVAWTQGGICASRTDRSRCYQSVRMISTRKKRAWKLGEEMVISKVGDEGGVERRSADERRAGKGRVPGWSHPRWMISPRCAST